jgi:EmrB/QacA subfamily drug resistance transporter
VKEHDEQQPRRAVLAVSLAAAFLTPFMVSSVNIALPAIGAELSMSAVTLSWVTTSYLLCTAVFLIPLGKIADTFGRKRIFFWGTVIVILSSLLSALAANGVQLIATRILHGIGAAMVFGTSMAMLTSVYPPKDRGKVLGINVSSTYTGLMLGPVLGGIITRYIGWRFLFWVNIPIGLAILVLVRTGIRTEWRQQAEGKFDLTGSVLYGISIALLLTGFSRLTTVAGILCVAAGGIGTAVFLVVEKHVATPVLPVRLFRHNRVFAFSNIAALINYSATYAVGFLMSLYLQYVKGLSPDRAGLLMVVQPAVMVLFSPVAGRLSDRVEPRLPASMGMGLIAFGLLLLSLLGPDSSIIRIVSNLMLLGLGFALFSSPNTSAVMGSVDRGKLGVASATVGTMRLLGQVLSMGITMLLMSTVIGSGKITWEQSGLFLQVMQPAGLLFGVLCTGGVFVSMVRGTVHHARASATSVKTT